MPQGSQVHALQRLSLCSRACAPGALALQRENAAVRSPGTATRESSPHSLQQRSPRGATETRILVKNKEIKTFL